jgi:hypothetical protein
MSSVILAQRKQKQDEVIGGDKYLLQQAKNENNGVPGQNTRCRQEMSEDRNDANRQQNSLPKRRI